MDGARKKTSEKPHGVRSLSYTVDSAAQNRVSGRKNLPRAIALEREEMSSTHSQSRGNS